MTADDYIADGPYRDRIALFLGYKRGKGEKCGRNLLVALRAISRALAAAPEATGLSEEAVRGALDPIPGESASTRGYRVSVMRQLCSFLASIGTPCWQVPARYFTAPRSAFRPYILSDADLSALFSAADRMRAPARAAGCERTYPVLVRLLASSGLRISEALALEVGDYSREDAVLRVENSKNGVSRLVPLSPGMATRLEGFLSDEGRTRGPLFASPYTGGAYSYDGAHHTISTLFDAAGVRTESGRRPRVHDLRHTFCTRSLDRMLASGMGLYEAVPILAAYVGHVNYADTEKYIHLTGSGHGAFVGAEGALGSLIPRAVV